MQKKNSDITLEEAMSIADIDNIILKRRNNGILISDYQLNVLNRNGINFLKYGSLDELLFDIEELLNDNYDEELDLISSQLAEYRYYMDTKK